MTNTNTILLAESGDLEVYEGKEPAKTIPVQYIECCCNPTKYGSCCGNGIPTWKEDHNPEFYHWLSTKKVVKMAEEELYKMIDYLNIWNKNVSYPIDVSDIVTEKDGLYYFYPPVDKEDETQKVGNLDLYTLESIKFMFNLFSDYSTSCLGYKELCKTIERKINH